MVMQKKARYKTADFRPQVGEAQRIVAPSLKAYSYYSSEVTCDQKNFLENARSGLFSQIRLNIYVTFHKKPSIMR